MITITINADNVSEAMDFLREYFNLKKINSLVATPRDDNILDILLFKADAIRVEIYGIFKENTEGTAALRELMEAAEFPKSTINQIFSMPKIEKFGVCK